MKLAEILTGPETWCQGQYDQYDQEGQRACLMGAVMRLYGAVRIDEYPGSVIRERFRLERLIGTEGVEAWNDYAYRTWDEVATVVDAYDRDRMLHP